MHLQVNVTVAIKGFKVLDSSAIRDSGETLLFALRTVVHSNL